MDITGVAVPSLGPTLDGVIDGIDAASNQSGASAVGDAVQIFSSVATDLAVPSPSARTVSDLAGYPDPQQYMQRALSANLNLSDLVPAREVFNRIVDRDFNFSSALEDAADGFLGKQGFLSTLEQQPQTAEALKIAPEQHQQLKDLQETVQNMVSLNRGVFRDMRA